MGGDHGVLVPFRNLSLQKLRPSFATGFDAFMLMYKWINAKVYVFFSKKSFHKEN